MWGAITIAVDVMVDQKGMLVILSLATLAASLAALLVANWFVQTFSVQGCEMTTITWRCRRRKVPEVILVPESPCPTMNVSSPRMSPPLSYKRKARRARKARIVSHARAVTKIYNPNLDGHCGFQAMLKAAHVPPTLSRVLWLRHEVAVRFHDARIADREVAQCNLHDVLRWEGLSLSAYCAALRRDLWASQVEIQLAAEVLGIAVRYRDGSVQTLGAGKPRFEIRKVRSHFILNKIHADKKQTETSNPLNRGGMQAEQQQEGQATHVPTPTAAPNYEEPTDIVLTFAPQIQSVRSMVLGRANFPLVGVLRTRLAVWLQVSVQSVCISTHDDEDLDNLPDWVQPPDHCMISLLVPVASFYRIAVVIQGRHTHFVMHVTKGTTRQAIEDQIANIIGTLPQFITLSDQHGQTWFPPVSLEDQIVTVVTTGFRAGAGNGTVSPTVPYSDDDNDGGLIDLLEDPEPYVDPRPGDPDYDSEPDRQFLAHQVEAAEDSRSTRSRSRLSTTSRQDRQFRSQMRQAAREVPRGSRSRSRDRPPLRDWSVESSVRRGSASPTRHGWTSSAPPQLLPPAQNEPVCKPVLEGETPIGYPIGYIWADPQASIDKVIISMHRDLKIDVAINHHPVEAMRWQETTRLQLAPRRMYDMPYLKDLRISRWELYQQGRIIPVFVNGDVEETILVPSHLTMTQVQHRLEQWRPWRLLYNLSAVDHVTWIINRVPLPQIAVQCVEAICGRRNLPAVKAEVDTGIS